jgi:hypothetical protein
VRADRLVIDAELQPGFYRCDLRTRDGGFDVDSLYLRCRFRSFQEGNIPDDPGSQLSGPWDYINDGFVVPRAEVRLNGKFVDYVWFDVPGIEALACRRAEASFGIRIRGTGRHRIELITTTDPRLRPEAFDAPVLRPDERAPLRSVRLRPDLKGVHPRLLFYESDLPDLCRWKTTTHRPLYEGILRSVAEMEAEIEAAPQYSKNESIERRIALAEACAFLGRLERDATWVRKAVEQALCACEADHWGSAKPGHMGCDNDMLAGFCLSSLSCVYDWLYGVADASALAALRKKILHHARLLYDFAVFQRGYWPTGYFQNHATACLSGLGAAGLAFLDEEPEAQDWIDWTRRSLDGTLELYSADGTGIPLDVSWGTTFTLRFAEMLLSATNESVYDSPGFASLYDFHRYFDAGNNQLTSMVLARRLRDTRWQALADKYVNTPQPQAPFTYLTYRAGSSAVSDDAPLCRHFADGGYVVMQSSWDPANCVKAVLHCGPPMGHSVFEKATRYNFAHAVPDMGGFRLSLRGKDLLTSAGASYRKQTEQFNTVTVDGQGQWGDGYVWMPKLGPDQVGRIVHYADTGDQTVAQADVTACYPPRLGLQRFLRTVVYRKPDLFLIHDVLESAVSERYQWRLHSPGLIEQADDHIYRIAHEGEEYFVRDLACLAAPPRIAQSEIVVQYRFDGHYATHICWDIRARHRRTELLFCLAPNISALRNIRTVQCADRIEVCFSDASRVCLYSKIQRP